MKFFIVAHQRSGTHYLASLLNSHPDLTCYDEIRRVPVATMYEIKQIDELGDNEGAIVMYNQLPPPPKDRIMEESKILHLTRDLEDTARSCIVLRIRGDYGLPAHTKKEIELPEIGITDELVEKMKEAVLERRSWMSRYKFKNVFEVEYEKLAEPAHQQEMLKFLEVDNYPLTTDLVKTNFSKAK